MYRHFLFFERTNETIEIDEPFGFDSASHKVERENNRFGKNITFTDFDKVELHDGQNHQFLKVKDEIENFGWECRIDYILTKNDIQLKVGKVDGITSKIFLHKIELQIIQDNFKSYLNKNKTVKINAFSNKDLQDNDIDPCRARSIFLKPKPIKQKSEWGAKQLNDFISGFGSSSLRYLIPINNNLINFGIEDSFSPFDEKKLFVGSSVFGEVINANRFITTKNTLTGLTINIENFNFTYTIFGIEPQVNLHFTKFTFINNALTVLEDNILASGQISNFNQTITTDLLSGQSLAIYVYVIFPVAVGNTINFNLNSQNLKIEATSQSIGTVIKGIRLNDIIRHAVNSMGGILESSIFTNENYINSFVMNGRMIGGLDDLPFYYDFNNLVGTFNLEAGADFQIKNENEFDFLPINDFYKDVEIGQFVELPDHEWTINANERLSINLFEIAFKKSSKDRENNISNTIDDVHTDIQLKVDSNIADVVQKIDLDHIRSAFLIEQQRRKANIVEEQSKTLENDDDLFAIDCVNVPPNFKQNFTKLLNVQAVNQELTFLSDGTFKWSNLGLLVGQQITENGHLLQVIQITDYSLRTQRLNNFTADFTGQIITKIEYSPQGVDYINRTNEGFAFVSGVETPENYSNLRFSLKRIFNNYKSWYNTAGQYLIGKNINVTKISINENLITRLSSETQNVIDKASIVIDDQKLVKGLNLNVKVFCNFAKATELISNIENERGYVSVLKNNNKVVLGYPYNLDYNFRSEELFMDLEVKDIITIAEYQRIFDKTFDKTFN